MNQQSDWTAGPVTMITWDELNAEVKHLPLLRAQKLHIQCVMSSFLLLPSPDLNLSNSKGLLTQFLPSVSELLLQPFPTEWYCSVYCLTALHLVQILEDFASSSVECPSTQESTSLMSGRVVNGDDSASSDDDNGGSVEPDREEDAESLLCKLDSDDNGLEYDWGLEPCSLVNFFPRL